VKLETKNSIGWLAVCSAISYNLLSRAGNSSPLKVKAAVSSTELATVYQTTSYHMLEDRNLHVHNDENFKCEIIRWKILK